MKGHTDLEQSRKLAEILPLESADMCFFNDGTAIKIDANSYSVRSVMWKDYEVEVIPCWSLAALLDVLNCPELTQTSDGGWFIRTWYLFHPYAVSGVNPVDVCYKIIIKLHEQKLL